MFGVLATPNAKTVDSRLSNIQSQLDKLLPKNGFKLLDARSERIVDGESITCSLGNGYSLTTLLVKPLDENGKVELRCELFHDKVSEFSTLVKTPVDQLFFCQLATERRLAVSDRRGRALSPEKQSTAFRRTSGLESRSSRRGAVAGSARFRRLAFSRTVRESRAVLARRQTRQRLRRVDLIVKANRPSLALGLQAASPSLDATAVFRPITLSSLTGSVFQPTWVVSAMRRRRLQRFLRSSAQRTRM